MSYLEELLPEFRKGAKIRCTEWESRCFVYCKNGMVYDQNQQVMPRLAFLHVVSDNWELYQDPEPDWDYIIKNKCLCWFWNDDDDDKYLGTIRFINKNYELPFTNWERGCAKNCRPVRRDEVTFYEDRKDD